jgi:hypothetical protein
VRRVVLFLVCAGCSFNPRTGEPITGDDDASVDVDVPDAPPGVAVRRIDITDGKVTGGPHADFPVLISLTDNDLRTVGNGGTVQNASGFDIGFFGDAGLTTRLAHEVERYDGASGDLRAWVKIPMLSDATAIFASYGDATITTSQEDVPAVWSAGYTGVWHLTDAASSTEIVPSTDLGTTDTAGQIEGARAFTGGGVMLDQPASASLDNVFAGGGTIEAWMFMIAPGGGNFGRIVDKLDVMGLGMCDGNTAQANSILFTHAFTISAGIWCTAQNTITVSTWTHVAVVYDSSSAANVPTFYIDGAPSAIALDDGATGTASSDAAGRLRIGNRLDSTRGWVGSLDEVRVAPAVRDPGWIATSHENQRRPGEFATLAPP